MEINRTNLTSIISTTLITAPNISTKAIQPTSVLSSTPVTSTVTLPIALSKQRIMSGNLTIINRVYTSELSNSSSKEYIEMAKEVNSSLVKILQNTPGFVDVEIRGFRNGSVVTIFYVKLESSSTITAQEVGNVTTTANSDNLTFSDVNVEELCTSGFCSNHGTCTKISNTQLQCSCTSGYTGPRCSSKVTATMNNTPIILSSATTMITTSSMFLGLKDSSIYQDSTSTVQRSTLTNTSTPTPIAGNETATLTTPFPTTNRTVIKMTAIPTSSVSIKSTVTPSTRNGSSTRIHPLPTHSSVYTISMNTTTFLSTLPILPSSLSTSMINSSLIRIVPQTSTQNYSLHFTSNVNESTIHANTTHLLTPSSEFVRSSNVSTFVPRNSPSILILTSLTISYNTSSIHIASSHTVISSQSTKNISRQTSQMASFNSSSPSLTTLIVSSTVTGEVNKISSAPSFNLTIFSSTHSGSKNYSITPTKTQASNQTIRSSFPTNLTIYTSKFSSHVINISTMEINRTNLTSIISTTLVTAPNISTKAIQPTSVLSSTPVTSTVTLPIASSKQRIVSGNLTITNRVYTSQLSNSSSKEYIEMATEVKSSLVKIFQNTPGFIDIEIRGFRNGSVVTIFYVTLESSSNITTQEVGNVITTTAHSDNLTFSNVNVEELCTSGFCSNHGTCTKISNTQLQCSCTSGYTGPRCSSKVTGSDDDDDDDFEEYWIAIGVCLGLLVLIIILLIFLALRRRRKYYVTRESVMSIGRTSGDVFFNPAYGHSREYLAGEDESSNVIPLEVVYENSSSSFKKDTYQESEFMSNKKSEDEEEEEDIYKTQLLLFLKQNNLLKNSSDDTQKPSWASSRSSITTTDSDSGL
ncbi:serine-rich adhesin for platelets-like [Paramuricea clavata]|uniref:Serine-rich adhesin for platelets-like, partial n=1 Tax=Paramuricea clavata TaxID=317549 RepID=A0A6S7H0S9_PARCT|nr:serine-rich adhesin for platelets-like [Paramuricea clavata]